MTSDPAPAADCCTAGDRPVLRAYFLLNYIVLLAIMSAFLRHASWSGWLVSAFLVAVFLVYSVLFLLPAILPVALLDRLLRGRPRRPSRWRAGVVYTLAVLAVWLVQLFLLTDAIVFGMFKWHLNGYVWNLLTTPGGIESMEMGPQATLYFELIIVAVLAGQAALMLAAVYWGGLARLLGALLRGRRAKVAIILAAALTVGQLATYAVSEFRGYRPVLRAATAFPQYLSVTVKGLGKRLGLKPTRDPNLQINNDVATIKYPLAPLDSRPTEPKYNIVLLVAESWRADMVAPDIMPATHRFAQDAEWFRYHYSGGHDTRMALFSMFYGLYGPYWFSFLNERRGPVLMDVLIDRNYQMFIHSSMAFTYPEFDKTLFARVPPEQLHTISTNGATWERDRRNITDMLAAIGRRDRARPFFAFMFFDSPHARYYFPPECAIRKPYLEDLNYATMDARRDSGLIKNRYVNSCNHLDTQIDRVLRGLESEGLMDSTIIVVAGDHGEEFMEKGHWGHASGYPEEQTRTPLILRIPGRAARQVNELTSHLDIAPTLLKRLGVANPPEDYCLGIDLLGDQKRQYVVSSGWDNMAYIDPQYKAILSTSAIGMGRPTATTADDVEIEDTSAFFKSHQAVLTQILRQLGRFQK